VCVMALMTAMTTVAAMHKEMKKRTRQKYKPRKCAQKVGLMFCYEVKSRNQEKHQQDDIGSRGEKTCLLTFIPIVIHGSNPQFIDLYSRLAVIVTKRERSPDNRRGANEDE